MRLGNRKNKVPHTYSFSFSTHISEKSKKANQIMGIIRRSFRYLNKEIFTKLFKSMVRPHLEYAASTWNPYHKQDIKKLESVQRRATKQVPELKDLSYKDRLTSLKMPTLAYRRMRGDLIETYKIVTGKYDKAVSDLLPLHQVLGTTTRGHSLKLAKPSSHKDLSKFFFTRRVVDTWNDLPECVIQAPSVNSFEKTGSTKHGSSSTSNTTSTRPYSKTTPSPPPGVSAQICTSVRNDNVQKYPK